MSKLVTKRLLCLSCDYEVDTALRIRVCPKCMGNFIEELHKTSDGTYELLEDQNTPPAPEVTGYDLYRRITRQGLIERRKKRFGPSFNPFDQMINEFIGNWRQVQSSGSSTMPGSAMTYGWDFESLEDMVNQFVNHMYDGTPPPLTDDQIKNIPEIKMDQKIMNVHSKCLVCLEQFALDEVTRLLSCNHLFHEHCICTWLKMQGTCPICRNAIFKPDIKKDTKPNINAADMPCSSLSGQPQKN